MALQTHPLDPADLIETPEDVVHFLEASFEDGTPAEIAKSLGTVARSRGYAALAREAGLSRQTLRQAFGEGGNPSLETFLKVIRALGLKLAIHTA
ncbi:MAG TPA: addiction module antidote protein [Caulobacteraceae bacterium]|nr:addiction module antidote protein [Caulobacteraceae bacterium]